MTLYFRILLTLFWALCSHSIQAEPFDFSTDNSITANADTDFLPVEEAYQLHLDVSSEKTVLIWQLAENYYLYRHGFKHQWKQEQQILEPPFKLSEGIKKEDEYFGMVEVYYQQVTIELENPKQSPLFLKASSQGCADAGLCYPPYDVYFRVDPANKNASSISADEYHANTNTAEATSPTKKQEQTNPPEQHIVWIYFAAFLGGLILNLMPCVFPVLSIKVIQLARQHDTRSTQQQGIAYLIGVVLSFVAIAAVMLSLRAGGTAVGWGFQLQNPWFIASLVYLFFILALGMSGVIALGQQWMGFGQSLTEKSGTQGAFFTGMLAVVVASPCTAPFMGGALGYAVSQPTPVALSVFAVLGLGMAAPLTLISFIPAASKLLPKPGHWMERLKEFFAFPLYATAIWLLWVLGNQTSTTGMAIILLGCGAISFAIWCFKSSKATTKILGLLCLLTALSLPFSDRLSAEINTEKHATNHTPFSTSALHQLRQEGQAVFIDLTADWCITCIANEKSTLEKSHIQQAFRDANIVYMVGDWTHFNPEISALLSEYNRSGIPLYLLFPPIADAPATILPQILTEDIVLDAIKNNE